MNEELDGVELINSSEEEIVLPSVNVDDVDDEEQEEMDTDTQEDYEEDEEQETQEEKTETKESLLEKALNAQRRENKQLKKEIKAMKKKATTKSTYDTLIEQGVEEELARTLSNAIEKPDDRIADLQFNSDLLRVSKKPEFADIEDYSDEVRALVDKGLTIEQSYYAVTGGKKKSSNTRSDIKRELEAKMKNHKQRADILDIDTSSNVYKPEGERINATPAEVAAAKLAGLTIREYKAIQKIASAKEYEKYKNSKIKK